MKVILAIKKGEMAGTVYRDVMDVARVVGVSRDTVQRKLDRGLVEIGEFFVLGCEYVKSTRGGKR